MNFKKIIFSLFAVFLAFALSAQFTPKTAGISSFARFFKSDTYFVFTGNTAVDSALITAVAENWTITNALFIPEDSFKVLTKDRDKSFVYISDLKRQGTSKQVKALCLVNGGYDDMATYLTNTLAYISIDNEGYEANIEEIIYRLGHLVYQLQDVVNIVKEENYIENSEEAVRYKLEKYYTKRCELVQQKTLLIDRSYLSQKIFSEMEFTNLYKYSLNFVNKSVIEKAIRDKDKSKVYLVSALNLYKINTVADCATGQILYIEFEEKNPVTNEFNKTFDRDDIVLLNGHIKSGK